MLVKLSNNEKAVLQTKSMEDSVLRDVYLDNNVVTSKLFKIYSNKDYFVYMSITFDKEPKETGHFRNIIRIAVGRLKELFEKSNASLPS